MKTTNETRKGIGAMKRPCIVCGVPSESWRCEDHPRKNRDKPLGGRHLQSNDERGYDYAWQKLSARARKLQPFCTDCGATTDLQADHTPQAWERKNTGKPIRLQDVDVVCGPCNRARGPARFGERKNSSNTPGTKPLNGVFAADAGAANFSCNS